MRRIPRLLATVVLTAAIAATTGCSAPGFPSAGADTHAVADPSTQATPPTPTPTSTPPPTPSIDLTAHSTTDPSSLWVVVNKKHPLPKSYKPELALVDGYQVSPLMVDDLKAMLAAAKNAGAALKIASAWRSYAWQYSAWHQRAAVRGAAEADRTTARAGFSEHQTGLALDLQIADSGTCAVEPCFGDTPQGKWLAAHAAEFGFIVRYTVANEAVTGYDPEPWHIRYVGRDLAAVVAASATGTLEEVFGIEGGDYATK